MIYIYTYSYLTTICIRLDLIPSICLIAIPETTVVSFVKKIDPTNVRGTGCNKIHFFASPENASKWIEKYPDMMFYPVGEMYQGLRQFHQKKYSDIIVDKKKRKCLAKILSCTT
jgi:hypothetical protein